jgi:hypothetical protein
MESIGIQLIVDFAKKYSHKRDFLALIIHSFTTPDPVTRSRMIDKIKEALGNNLKVFYSLLAHISQY